MCRECYGNTHVMGMQVMSLLGHANVTREGLSALSGGLLTAWGAGQDDRIPHAWEEKRWVGAAVLASKRELYQERRRQQGIGQSGETRLCYSLHASEQGGDAAALHAEWQARQGAITDLEWFVDIIAFATQQEYDLKAIACALAHRLPVVSEGWLGRLLEHEADVPEEQRADKRKKGNAMLRGIWDAAHGRNTNPYQGGLAWSWRKGHAAVRHYTANR